MEKRQKIIELIEEIDLQLILEKLCNEPVSYDRIEFWYDPDANEIELFELSSNSSIQLKDCQYLFRLKTYKGEYDFLWEGYASYNEELDRWITETGSEYKTRRDLRNHCLEDYSCFEEIDWIRKELFERLDECIL